MIHNQYQRLKDELELSDIKGHIAKFREDQRIVIINEILILVLLVKRCYNISIETIDTLRDQSSTSSNDYITATPIPSNSSYDVTATDQQHQIIIKKRYNGFHISCNSAIVRNFEITCPTDNSWRVTSC
ncbi:hypothetical protein ACTFIV_007735 [Dictyostelium citrinum]